MKTEIDSLVEQYLEGHPNFKYPPSEDRHPAILALGNEIKGWLIERVGGPLPYWQMMLRSAKIWFKPDVKGREFRIFCNLFEAEGNISWSGRPEFELLTQEYKTWRGINESYDKAKGVITTSGNKKEFEKNLFIHFAEVQAKVDAELAKKEKNNPVLERINLLSRATRISIVIFITWTLYVFFRTLDSYELLGLDLNQWDDDYFFLNWLAVPASIAILYKAGKWALSEKNT